MTDNQQSPIIRIIARRVPWPSLQQRPNREGLRLQWDAIEEATGRVLCASTEEPLIDGAFILLLDGICPEAPVTMRHEGMPFDSLIPMPLSVPAAKGHRRAKRKAEIAARRLMLSQETAELT